MLHVLGDIGASVGVIVGGLVILATGWYAADRLISLLIAVLIARSAACSFAVSRASMASQNRRWSVAAAGTFVNRGPAVVAHHGWRACQVLCV